MRFFLPNILLFLFCVGSAFAQPAGQRQGAFSVRLWQVTEGLPHNIVRAVCRTSDGYLWVGTQEGLARFDGFEFTIFNAKNTPALASDCITALCEGRDQALWIGTKKGIVSLQHETFTREKSDIVTDDISVRCLFADRDGSIWAGHDTGVLRRQNGKWMSLSPEADHPKASVSAIAEDARGTVYLGMTEGLKFFSNGVFQNAMGQKNPFLNTRAICATRGENLWISSGRSLFQFASGNYSKPKRQEGLTQEIVTTLCEDSRGQIWVGTYGGLNLIADANRAPAEIGDGTGSFSQINVVCEDIEGIIWVGSKDGLARLRPKPFMTYSKRDGLGHNDVTSVLEDCDGRLWIGTHGGGLNYFEDGRIQPVSEQPYQKNLMIMALSQDRDGLIWCGFDLGGKWAFLENGRTFKYPVSEQQMPKKAVKVIHQTKNGDFLIGMRGALYRVHGQTLLECTNVASREIVVRDIEEENDGRIWVAAEDGLWRLENDRLEQLSGKNGFPEETVYCFFRDAAKTLWLGTRTRLGFFKNESIRWITWEQGGGSREVYSIVEDDTNHLWMGSPRGVLCASIAALQKAAENSVPATCDVYDETDGLLTSHCNNVAQPSAWKARDGRLWFATSRGLAVIDPRFTKQRNARSPQVIIDSLLADKKPIHTRASFGAGSQPVLEVPPGRGELEFHYTALSLVSPEKNQFKYRLEGIDPEWVDAGTRRVANYNNLPPGSYAFHVQACNNDGVWNDSGVALAFVLRPHFWQTIWFRTSLVAAAAAVFFGIVHARRARRLEMERLRLRIAGDLHDELGSNLSSIALLSGRVSKRVAMEPREKAELDEIRRIALQTTNSVRDIVWFINPENDSLDQMMQRMRELASVFLGETPYEFSSPTSLGSDRVTPEFRRNFFLIFKETLNNIVQHSQCTRVEIRLERANGDLILAIRDNGRGFDVEAKQKRRGNGLKNLRLRVEQMNGTIEITSEPGKGTTVRCVAPLK